VAGNGRTRNVFRYEEFGTHEMISFLIQQLPSEFSSELATIRCTVSSWNDKGMSHHRRKTRKGKTPVV
jgi:hypothetical protein